MPDDFTVQTWDGAGWATRATVTGNDAVTRRVRFEGGPVTTDRVRIVVTRAETRNGEFSRVAELSP